MGGMSSLVGDRNGYKLCKREGHIPVNALDSWICVRCWTDFFMGFPEAIQEHTRARAGQLVRASIKDGTWPIYNVNWDRPESEPSWVYAYKREYVPVRFVPGIVPLETVLVHPHRTDGPYVFVIEETGKATSLSFRLLTGVAVGTVIIWGGLVAWWLEGH